MRSTRQTVLALYSAFRDGDAAAMLSLLDDVVEVRFLGVRAMHGLPEARAIFELQEGILADIDFQVSQLIVDGEYAAGVWHETARTTEGAAWSNHGVDVFRVKNGKVVSLHENNDVRKFYRFIPDQLRATPQRNAS